MVTGLKINLLYWYKKDDDRKFEIYTWNPLVSWLRLLLLVFGVIFCAQNMILMAIVDMLMYLGFYIAYLYFNREIVQKINMRTADVKTEGFKYSFRRPLTITVRK